MKTYDVTDAHWARERIINECDARGLRHPRVDVVNARSGRNGSNGGSSGYCSYGSHIRLRFGAIEVDRRTVTLHELAHWIRGKPVCPEGKRVTNRSHHDRLFWKICVDLYETDEMVMDNLHFVIVADSARVGASGFLREIDRRGWLAPWERLFTHRQWVLRYWDLAEVRATLPANRQHAIRLTQELAARFGVKG